MMIDGYEKLGLTTPEWDRLSNLILAGPIKVANLHHDVSGAAILEKMGLIARVLIDNDGYVLAATPAGVRVFCQVLKAMDLEEARAKMHALALLAKTRERHSSI